MGVHGRGTEKRLQAPVPVPKRQDEPATKAAVPPPARRRWTTDAGPVFIEQRGEWVVALESFDEATANKLADAILAGARVGPAQP